ncbi:MAG TPA: Ig-like domain-containing protein [Gemmatimonadaceae bacterium]|nr:Ig-like domain-containing protein [Gemmatimonadaceae bacterium]
MHALPFALLLLAQQSALPQANPISRVVISPAARTIRAGDTVQFSAQAYDASGAVLQNAKIRFGGGGSGAIDTTGKVVASAIGKMPIVAVATVPGSKPVVERREIEIIPAPAARVDIRIAPTKLVVGQQARVEAVGYSRANDRAVDPIQWTSSAPRIVRVEDGLISAVAAGRATLTAAAGTAKATVTVQVIPNTITSLTIAPARPKVRTGDVVTFTARTRSSSGDVSGLTPTWAMQGNGVIDAEGTFVAYDPGPIVVTATLGNRSASTIVEVEERDIRRPVSIVGRLPRTEFTTAEVWIHPNGKVAYLGTHGGGDRVYTIDISNPATPTVVDSVVMNTRLVNDVMTDKAGTVLIMTREGAADRKNGIVIASLEDPLRPKVISEFTDGVTAGVHSAFVYTQPNHGTHIYLTNDGTGAVHIIDINDPKNPKEVAQWRTTNRPDAGRYVHDIDVQDGLLYASYWDDGLVILDIGKGVKGGSPSNPQIVTQFKYNLDSLYRQVEAESGPGFTRGTHTAWRHRNYVFIADEVYRASQVKGAKDESADRMYGTLQVIDVSDLEAPKSVAWYTPENGGVHNVWVSGDTLYMGAYDGGFRVFDVSGELKGDLRAQGREIAFVSTADMQGKIQNQAMTWGVVVNPADGLAYVNDFYNGLWIVRVEPRSPPVP